MLLMMKLNLKKFITNFALLLLLMVIIHLLLYRGAANYIKITLQQLSEIYGFLLLLNVAHFIALSWLFKKWAKYAGLLFTAISLLKMTLCVLFLWPYIFPSTINSIPVVINFMIIYLITLGYEVVFIVKNLMKVL